MRALCFLLTYAWAGLLVEIGEYGEFLLVNPDYPGSGSFELISGDYFVIMNDKTYSGADGTLVIDQYPIKSSGSDQHGAFVAYAFNALPKGLKQVKVVFTIRVYETFAVFRQSFPNAIKWNNTDHSILATSFPSVKIPPVNDYMFYVNPCSVMAGHGARQGEWNYDGMGDYCGGEKGGIMFIHDKANPIYKGRLFAISAFRHFTALYTDINNGNLDFGLPRSAAIQTEANYSIETIISYSNDGFYNGVQKWGGELLLEHGKSLTRRASDLTVNYLGYWTDRGAFYYYNTEPNKTYAETMLDIYHEVKAPYQSWNYDSWFYPKCEWVVPPSFELEHQAVKAPVKNWTAMADIFPGDSIKTIYQKTKLPVIAHNRWWCNETDYAKRSGGSYNFIYNDANGTSLPIDQQFWDDLFKNATEWGLTVYLQDWIQYQVAFMPQMKADLTLERNWLIQMGNGAEKNNINILYCAAMPRQMLQSVEIANVVSIRASGDYQPSNDNWKNGLSDIWTYALGLSPFKDTFWSTKNEPGNPQYQNMTENDPSLEAAFATLSTGTVALGDEIGKQNMTLINRSITPDGLVLKPSRPLATPNYRIWPKNAPIDEFETLTRVSNWTFGIILAHCDDEKASMLDLNIRNYHFHNESQDYIVGLYNDKDTRYQWSVNDELNISVGNLTIVYASPIWHQVGGQFDIGLMGEMDKWTPVSPNRFKSIDVTKDSIHIEFTGAANEEINVQFYMKPSNGTTVSNQSDNNEIIVKTCTIPSSGSSQLIVDASKPEPVFNC